MDFDRPNNFTGEITILGTGGGYGESCVIHLGSQKWVVVDSCIDPISKKSIPLKYLEGIGVNTNSDVVLIICTHWHEDHILGLSQLLQSCSHAKFSFAKANDRPKFLQMVSLDYEKISKEATFSSTKEFVECLEIMEKRNPSGVIMSHPDRILYSVNKDDFNSQVISLSPSDTAIHQFDLYISTLITEYGKSNMRIVPLSPNFNSVAIFLKLGYHRAILGGDLETDLSNSNIGWDDVVNKSQAIDNKSTFIKIPHHGSKNGYNEGLWKSKLHKAPISTVTPWNLGSKLPTQEMMDFYKGKSEAVFITSTFFKQKPKKRSRTIKKLIDDYKIELEEIPFIEGTIRGRIDLSNPKAEWIIDSFGTATKL
jgi:beta-lactamase superfamily II metal-dependent hydrolase